MALFAAFVVHPKAARMLNLGLLCYEVIKLGISVVQHCPV